MHCRVLPLRHTGGLFTGIEADTPVPAHVPGFACLPQARLLSLGFSRVLNAGTVVNVRNSVTA